MPTYEYECKKCGHCFEVFQAMSDEPIKTCTKCGKEVRRLIFGGAGVIFKGSGFYVTDKGKSAQPEKSSAARAKTTETSGTAQGAVSPQNGGAEKANASERSTVSEKSTASERSAAPEKSNVSERNAVSERSAASGDSKAKPAAQTA